jgi:hypothetical protein
MKLDNFDAVFWAANKLFLNGESLVCMVEGRTVVIRPVEALQAEIEALYLSDETHNHVARRFNQSNYKESGLEQLNVATRYMQLLTQGETYGGQKPVPN